MFVCVCLFAYVCLCVRCVLGAVAGGFVSCDCDCDRDYHWNIVIAIVIYAGNNNNASSRSAGRG